MLVSRPKVCTDTIRAVDTVSAATIGIYVSATLLACVVLRLLVSTTVFFIFDTVIGWSSVSIIFLSFFVSVEKCGLFHHLDWGVYYSEVLADNL